MVDAETIEKEIPSVKEFKRNLTENQLRDYLNYLEKSISGYTKEYEITRCGEDASENKLEINLGAGAIISLEFKRNVYFGVERETDEEVLGYSGYTIPHLEPISDKKIELIERVSNATDEFFTTEYNNIKNKL